MVIKILCLLLLVACTTSHSIKKPNIVFIVADDLGWDDVSYHGSNQIFTPNIDNLAYHGTVLKNYYTDAEGTPSRSALFTGKYPMRFGGQGGSIAAVEDRGIPPTEIFLSDYLKDLGYSTHLIGKWQLGKSRKQYLPTNRGFDTFYGCLDGAVDYFTHDLIEKWNGNDMFGHNLYYNMEPADEQSGYLTNIFTDRAVQLIREHNTSLPLYLHVSHAAPHAGGGLVNLQTPVESITSNDHILHSARRLYAGMVTLLDKSVGNIVAALAERDILNNTLIIFVSDNGAPTTAGPYQNFGCNLPLRGVKATPWEGAVKSPALLWHAALPSRINNNLFHVTDWLPTLVAAAGGKSNRILDGFNQWNVITKNEKSNRDDILIGTDDLKGWAAFREGDFKIIVGNVDKNNSFYHGSRLKETRRVTPSYENMLLESETARVLRRTLNLELDLDLALEKRNNSNLHLRASKMKVGELCIPIQGKGCLYNISADPLESQDLWYSSPKIVRHLTVRMRAYWAKLKPRGQVVCDDRSDPALRNYVWSPWLDESEPLPEYPTTTPPFPLHISGGEMEYLVEVNMNSLVSKMNTYLQKAAESFVEKISAMVAF